MNPETANFETEMKRAFLEILLRAFLEEEMHDYFMIRSLRELWYKVEENTLYPLVRRLEKNGWVKGNWGLRKGRPLPMPS